MGRKNIFIINESIAPLPLIIIIIISLNLIVINNNHKHQEHAKNIKYSQEFSYFQSLEQNLKMFYNPFRLQRSNTLHILDQ